LQPFVGGKLEGDDHHIGRDPFELLHPAWKGFDLDVLYGADFATFNDEFREGYSPAKQCHSRLFFRFRQRVLVIAAEIHCSLYDFALAGSAGAVAAAVGEWKTLPERGLKNSLAGLGEKAVPARLDGNLMGHDYDYG